MTFEAALVAILAVLSLAVCITGWISLDSVGIGLLIVLVASGILDVDAALAGFANSTVVTLAGLYVIGEGLTRTGALEFVAAAAIRRSQGSEVRLLLLLCFTAAAISSVVSDTAVVLVFTPLAIGIARERRIPLSRLLLPIAYAALLGGTLTLVGSSINLLTSGAAESHGAAPLGFFETTFIGGLLVLLGVPAVVLLARRLLPDRSSLTDLLASSSAREYVTEVDIGAGSPLIGRTVAEVFTGGPRPVAVVHDDEIAWTEAGSHLLEQGDVVMLQGDVGQLAELQSKVGVSLVGSGRYDPRTMSYFELAVAPHAAVIGSRIADLRLFRDFGVLVVAVLRGGRHIRERASRMELRSGDVLLVCGGDASRERMFASTDFFLLSGAQRWVIHRQLGRRALWVLAVVVALFILPPTLGLSHALPVPFVSLAGALAMVATGCVTARRAYESIDWRILLFVTGALALGKAMEGTGLANACAHAMVTLLRDFGPLAITSGLLLLGTVLNQFTSPYAVTLLLTPIAIATAHDLGVDDVRPFILAIAFAGSNAFATPMGHQVNLMVMGPGGYRYGDYLRVGVPMCLLTWVIASAGLAVTAQW